MLGVKSIFLHHIDDRCTCKSYHSDCSRDTLDMAVIDAEFPDYLNIKIGWKNPGVRKDLPRIPRGLQVDSPSFFPDPPRGRLPRLSSEKKLKINNQNKENNIASAIMNPLSKWVVLGYPIINSTQQHLWYAGSSQADRSNASANGLFVIRYQTEICMYRQHLARSLTCCIPCVPSQSRVVLPRD